MQLRSLAFEDGGFIPQRHVMPGAGGDNVSLPLAWSDVPDDTQSFALSIVDPHPVADNWIHWLVVDLPAETRELAEGASGGGLPGKARELRNSFGESGYGGPQPPPGSGVHPYVVTIYALDVDTLDLGPETDLQSFIDTVEKHALDQSSVTGKFER